VNLLLLNFQNPDNSIAQIVRPLDKREQKVAKGLLKNIIVQGDS